MRDPDEKTNILVCSANIKPVRNKLPRKLRTWLHRIAPMHTFVVRADRLPLSPDKLDGYWFCAGDFCDPSEPGVFQHIDVANIRLSECLVASNVHPDDLNHSELVIGGEYCVHYVCHNITNRVIFGVLPEKTLVDLDIPAIGYSLVVKSPLGVYGQNTSEWAKRKEACQGVDIRGVDDPRRFQTLGGRTRLQEIDRIHTRACRGDSNLGRKLTEELKIIDQSFYTTTERYSNEFATGTLSERVFHEFMYATCNELYNKTVRAVGHEIADRIYPGCQFGPNSGGSAIVNDSPASSGES